VVALGTLSELLARSHANEVIELKLSEPPASLEAVERLEGVLRVELAGTELRVFTSRAQRVLAALCTATPFLDQSIVTTKVTPINLENVFIELTGKAMRD
jgi:hypothetical protein